MQIRLASPRGFCAGVERAIEIVERALAKFGAPIYVRHEVGHNLTVVEDLKAKGVIFIEELEEVPDGATVIFSAHGVSRAVKAEASARDLVVFDATCPLVAKVHNEVVRSERSGREIILIGHSGHPEVEGTLGHYDPAAGGAIYLVEDVEQASALAVREPEQVSVVTQTTLSMDDTAAIMSRLPDRFPAMQRPRTDAICYATQNRQDAVRELAEASHVVIVVGSRNSSNSNRLRELAERLGTRAYLIDDEQDLAWEWFEGVTDVGVTSGASAPEACVQAVIERLIQWGGRLVGNQSERAELVEFSMPKGLR